MASLRRRPLVVAMAVIAASTLLLGACSGSDGSDGTDGTDSKGGGKAEIEGITRAKPLDVGGLSLPEVSADGSTTPFAFKADPGKLLFVAFGYTNCPDVCPTTLYDMKKARKKMGSDGAKVDEAFATVDPERDTAKVLTDYLGSFTKGGHPLRTTDEAALRKVEERFGITSSVVKQPDGSTEVSHTARSFVVDDQGKVVVEWSFGTTPDAMASDLAILLRQEAEPS